MISESDFLHVVEDAALAAARTMGAGNAHAADQAAVTAMRKRLNTLAISGTIVIGEGERDEAPMLYIGERVGKKSRGHTFPKVDIAVDPLEGTNLTAQGLPQSITVLAASEAHGLLHAPDVYMNKLVVSPKAAGKVHITFPTKKIIATLARCLKRTPQELVCVVLDRPRHTDLIAQIRSTGARIQLIPDGDIAPAIAATMHGYNVHALLGIGAAPEGVIAAAAVKMLGGYMEAQFVSRNAEDTRRLREAGIVRLNKIYTHDDLAPGKDIVVAMTGVTNGDVVRGVRFFPGGARTHSMVLSMDQRSVRFVDTIHALEPKRLHTSIHFV